jgi:hypothetical protein
VGGRVARVHDTQPTCVAPEHSVRWLERTEDLEETREHDAWKDDTLPRARHLQLRSPRQIPRGSLGSVRLPGVSPFRNGGHRRRGVEAATDHDARISPVITRDARRPRGYRRRRRKREVNVSTKIAILCVAAAAAAAGSVEAATCPIAAQVSARRPTVMLGEPIDLTLVLRNTTAGAIELRAPSENSGNVRLSIAENANPTAFRSYNGPEWGTKDARRPPVRLKKNGSLRLNP